MTTEIVFAEAPPKPTFSMGTANVLKDLGITTLEQLSGLSCWTLLDYKNLGKRALTEIETTLAYHHLHLKNEAFDPITWKKKRESVKRKIRRYEEELNRINTKIQELKEAK